MKKHAFPLILIGLTALVWIFAYPKLPDQIPGHWGLNGEVDRYDSKFVSMLSQLGILVLLYVTMAFLPKIDPRKANYRFFSKSYSIIMNALLAIFFAINMLVILSALGTSIPISELAPTVLGVVFIMMGNYFQQVRSNFFIGIRTPWTLSSEDVWKKTHRLSGKLFFAGGILLILVTFLPDKMESIALFSIISVMLIVPYVYSYLLFSKEK
ncbi:SdpI family protein [Bacillus massilinigeriensis]|uniref:SdpI family protein n=1 Tax=Bacillus mediterraneensis TaxID=1805474 RepID=UPI0008F8DE84|nr:SdpI family protein [Bacillus mediterraneensis]